MRIACCLLLAAFRRYTAALYTARAFLKPLMLAGAISGGQLMLTSEVENFPGYPKGVTGPELMQDLREQALRFDAEIRNESVVSVDFSSRPFRISTRDDSVLANTVIISTGADALWLNAKNEDALRSNGVSTCATCDGFFYRGKDVLVAGGGDTAMEEALYLANLAKSVTVVHRRGEFRASKVMRERVLNHPKIQVKYHRVVDEWIGTAQDGLKGAILRDPRNGEISSMWC
jgi:thioredoxin reductase (NADPH)